MRAVIGLLLALAAPVVASAATVTLDSTRGAMDSGELRQSWSGDFYLRRGGARNSRSVQSLALGPGEYEISFLSGPMMAWNRWGRTVRGCDAGGANCARGWETSFAYFVMEDYFDNADVTPVNWFSSRQRGARFSSAQAAFDAVAGRVIERFTLTRESTIGFFIPDDFVRDNRGGVTLDVARVDATSTPAAVPLPAAIWMFGLSLAALPLAAWRRAR